jgi:hypothetical protein
MRIYLDFDGTVVEHTFPNIGEDNPLAIETIKQLIKNRHEVILNTLRSEISHISLENALFYLRNKGLILKHTDTKIQPLEFDLEYNVKIGVMYIDDISVGTPLIDAKKSNGRMVDWAKLRTLFIERGIIKRQ